MKKSLIVLLHLGYWGCFFILILFMVGIFYGARGEVSDEELEVVFRVIFFLGFLPAVICFYFFYTVLFPRYLLQERYLETVLYGLLGSLVAGALGYALMTIIMGGDCLGEAEADDGGHLGFILLVSLDALISGIIALIMQGFITWFEEINLKKTLQEKNQEMELALVKAQLDPHFLFNTINNIDVLILKDAGLASEYLNKLSDIMRFMLYETKTEAISLQKELAYIRKYIELQRIRSANDTYVKFSIEGQPDDRLIAPMIFIPFIENAFKHTNNKKLAEAIVIELYIESDKIRMICQNKFDPTRKSSKKDSGLGMNLIRRRLELLYPDRHQLRIDQRENQYWVDLIIEIAAVIPRKTTGVLSEKTYQ